MKILMPVDGSDYTKRMLAYLAAHSELLPGNHEYTVFNVIEPFSPYDTSFAKAVSMEDFHARPGRAGARTDTCIR